MSDENGYRHDIKSLEVGDVQDCKIEILARVRAATHTTSVRLCSSSINRVEPFCDIVPCALHLNANQPPIVVNGKIIRQPIPNRAKYTKPSFQQLSRRRGFGNVRTQFGITEFLHGHQKQKGLGAASQPFVLSCNLLICNE